ncbi:MAG: flagellar biosynthesis protein FlhB [Tabrizicola sp.]|nr:flagellar biosynthesis protein FlhB [Tabrizicola sp.]
MSGGDTDDDDKQHDPSQQRLDRARQEGDIPRSNDLIGAASLLGYLAAFVWFGGWVFQAGGGAGMVMLDQADSLSTLVVEGASGPIGGAIISVATPLLAIMALPVVMVSLLLAATRGFVVTPSKLGFRLSRLSPLATAKHKFGREGLAEFAKSTAKLVIISIILYKFLAGRADEILASLYLDPGLSASILGRLTLEFLMVTAVIAVAVGGLDYIWQRHLYIERNRMTRKEMMDEFKDSEGDPHMKSSRRQRAQEIATNRMLVDVAKADVIVVNPTHYAVALRWDRKAGRAPVCVAKGVDEVAKRIREKAAEHGVPIHSDPPTARAMHATIEIGQEIRAEHYRAVAAAIRFADTMRKKAAKRR